MGKRHLQKQRTVMRKYGWTRKDHSDFKKWWNPDKFDWREGSSRLAKHCSKYFDTWWNPDKFDWEKGSKALAAYCTRHFHKWWDPEKFNWREGSSTLASRCAKHFDTWWDPERFVWNADSFYAMAKHHQDKIHIWVKHAKTYELTPKCLEALCKQLGDHFDQWWPHIRTCIGLARNPRYIDCLERHLPHLKEIWLPDILRRMQAVPEVPSTVALKVVKKCVTDEESRRIVLKWLLQQTLESEHSS